MNVILSADIGGTRMRFGLHNADPEAPALIRRVSVPTNGHDYEAAKYLMGHAAERLMEGVAEDIVAFGAGIPGVIDNGILTASGNLPGWNGEDVGSDIRRAFGLSGTVPTAVLNDAEAAALGEYTKLYEPFVYVIWGTGIGVAVVTIENRKPRIRATELGHMCIDRRSRVKCGCDGYGHWEALVSGGNIDGKRFTKGLIRKRAVPIHNFTEKMWDEVLRDMAIGLRTLSEAHMGVQIVIGGGVACKQKHRLLRLQDLVAELPSPAPTPLLLIAAHGEDSGLYGAAEAGRRALHCYL